MVDDLLTDGPLAQHFEEDFAAYLENIDVSVGVR